MAKVKMNADIRNLIKNNGFTGQQIADQMKISINTYYVLLRIDLTPNQKRVFYQAIDQCSKKRLVEYKDMLKRFEARYC